MVRKFLLVALLVVIVLGVTHAFADGTTCQPSGVHLCNEGPQGNASCSDGIDNDQDGAIDNLDPDCKEDASQGPNAATCHDGIDNDRDGLIDDKDPDCQPPDPCTAQAGDPGLLTDDTLAQTLWDSGLMIPPLTEDPDRDGAITGPLGDAFQPPDGPLAALEPLGDEATCAGDLALDQDALPDL